MTSDAKIGLLLGLIFIFVIAFIINGLPTLRPQTTKAEAVTNVMRGQDENLGVADGVQKARETISWAELLGSQGDEPAMAAEEPGPAPVQSVAADTSADGIRSVVPLPGPDGLERLTRGLENIVRDLARSSGSAARETTEPAPIVEVARTDQGRSANTVTPAAVTVGRTYVVQDGENLASVAKKVYGPEEGNRIVNIQRIYEANRNILKSPDEVRAGEELVIPPPAKPVAKKPDNVLPASLFEKVREIGSPRTAATEKKQPEKPAAGERWYVVQQDDSLWKIAATQLGNGARYEEIVKLNPDVVKDSSFVDVGTRLRLPAK
jgi:nucleoid-associated protein YgaU